MEPLHQALTIIKNVEEVATSVRLNKRQCKRLADRFGVVSKALRSMTTSGVIDEESDDGYVVLQYPALDELLVVLKKGEDLISSYILEDGLSIVLSRADNREAFKEVHDEIDSLKTYLYLDTFGENSSFETISRRQRDEMLRSDAEEDGKEMPAMLQNFKTEGIQVSSSIVVYPSEVDMTKMGLVVSEKCQAATDVVSNMEDEDSILPSYLRIDTSGVEAGAPVKPFVRQSDADLHLEGLALVHRGQWLGCPCAIKVFKSNEFDWNKAQLHKEVLSLIKLRHPHIVQLIGFAQDEQKSFVLMELMDSDLRHLILSRLQKKTSYSKGSVRPFTRSESLNIISQIARGMFYLHRQGYIHGELKCSNVLVKGSTELSIDVKITDFYCSRELGKPLSTKTTTRNRPRWTAPEAITYSAAVDELPAILLQKGDVYSFGMTCYEIVTGLYPFDGVRGPKLVEEIKAGTRPDLPNDLGEALVGLITSCWNPKPECRPAFENICHILDFIRSSEPIIAVKSSGIHNVMNRLREVPTLKAVLSKFYSPDLAKKHVEEKVHGGRGHDSRWTDEDEKARHGPLEKVFSSATVGTVPKYLAIDPLDLKKVRRIGEGASAKVYEVTWLGCRFALKRFRPTSITYMQREMDFLITLLHPHVVRLVGFSSDSQFCSIIMEFMDNDLRGLIDSRVGRKSTTNENTSIIPFTHTEVLHIISQIALGMAFLHSRGVMHRDLKASNVLVRNEHTGSLDMKIVDFGMSEYVGDSQRRGVGTGFWRAPEILETLGTYDQQLNEYNLKAADVYSFSMTCYEVLTGRVPFKELNRSDYAQVISGKRPMLPDNLMPDLVELVHKCWHQDPDQRPSFAQICEQLAKFQAVSESCEARKLSSGSYFGFRRAP